MHVLDDIKRQVNERISTDVVLRSLIQKQCTVAARNTNRKMFDSKYSNTVYFEKLLRYIDAIHAERRFAQLYGLGKYEGNEYTKFTESRDLLNVHYQRLIEKRKQCKLEKDMSIYE